MKRKMCRHCHKRKISRPKQLCFACSMNSAIRMLYPESPKCTRKCDTPETEDEVDALVREQMKTLPKWWNQDQLGEQALERDAREHPRKPAIRVYAFRSARGQHYMEQR